MNILPTGTTQDVCRPSGAFRAGLRAFRGVSET